LQHLHELSSTRPLTTNDVDDVHAIILNLGTDAFGDDSPALEAG
jgi:hypothetical protein